MNALQEEEPSSGLRIASSLRFVFTKKNKEPKVVDIKKSGDEPKQRGRKVSHGNSLASRTKNELIVDETKRLKSEWGRAFKHMNDGKPPTFDIFFQISKDKECSTDPFYQKIFREMSYGTFPKGVFYDKNRDCLVCTEVNGRRNSVLRQTKMEKFVRVCIPGRLNKTILTPTQTNEQTRDNETRDTDMDLETRSAKDLTTLSVEDQRELMEKRAVKFIYRCNQRLELPVEILHTKYGLPLERVYQEIKLFLYMTIDLLSPWDANILQEESYQCIKTKERVTALKPKRSWKKLSQLEQISFICQFCKIIFFSLLKKPLDKMSPHHERIFGQVKDYLCGLLIVGYIPPSAVEFDSCIRKIHGVEITLSGVKLNKMEIEQYRCDKPDDDSDITIVPVTIQKYKTVDLQKISNGVQKQTSKTSKMIKVLTETDMDTTLED